MWQKCASGSTIMNSTLPLETVTRLIAEACCLEQSEIIPERDLTEYGLDSARAMDLVVSVEDAFNVEISDETMMRLRTANDIVQALEAR